jgi:hypothetical protein
MKLKNLFILILICNLGPSSLWGAVETKDANPAWDAEQRLLASSGDSATRVPPEPSPEIPIKTDLEKELDENAKTLGYKTANLMKLHEICSDFAKSPHDRKIQFKVPRFFGIPSAQVMQAFTPIQSMWSSCVASTTEQDRTFQEKKFSPAFLEAHKKFTTDLNTYLDSLILPSSRTLDAFFVTNGLDSLLTDTQTKNYRLMVRSTGREDTRELANAGGNASVPNVEATPETVLAAIKRVIASYFSLKSLTQRLEAGDQSIFNPDPFMPVLIQEMVGETDSATVSSGVMFTEEPEGGIGAKVLKNPDGSIKTTGITLVQAAYGHNEAVVNSLVATDSYYITTIPGSTEPAIYPVIRAKEQRLKPTPGGLEMTPNPSEIILSPSLSKEILIALKHFADQLEKSYGYPLDVEFVVQKQTIFIVQARPIVYRATAQPSYISGAVAGDRLTGSTIVAAGCNVRTITQPSQLIIAPTIISALDIFLDPTKKAIHHDLTAVIIGSMASSLSHPAITFRNNGIPVLYIPENEKIITALRDGKTALISPQQSTVLLASAETELPITQGWCSYPVPKEMSVLPNFLGTKKTTNYISAPKDGTSSLANLIAIMKTRNSYSTIDATAEFCEQLDAAIKKYPAARDLEINLRALLDAAVIICQQIVALAHLSPSDDTYPKRLLPIKMLEALTYQQLDYKTIAKPLSVATLVKTLKDETAPNTQPRAGAGSDDAAVTSSTSTEKSMPAFKFPKLGEYYVQLRKLCNNIFVDEVRADWLRLLAAAAGDEKLMTTITHLVKQLNNASILPSWLHSDFATGMQKIDATAGPDTMRALLQESLAKLENDNDFLTVLQEKRKQIKAVKPSAFAQPAKCQAAWANFVANLNNYFAAESFTAPFTAAGDYGKQSAVEIMREYIDIFDQSIKSVTGCAESLPEELQLSLFKQMLQENFRLVEAWTRLVDEKDITAGESTPKKYLAMMHTLVNKAAFTKADLNPTQGISPAIFAMGAGHDWVGDWKNPQLQSGEDVFSAMHQSLINFCTLLSHNKERPFTTPLFLDRIETELRDQTAKVTIIIDTKQQKLKACLVGKKTTPFRLIKNYNIPLRSHSCQIELKYQHSRQPEVILTAQFAGGNALERYRWCNVAGLVLAAQYLPNGMPTKIIELANHYLKVELRINNTEQLALFSQLWVDILHLSDEDNINYQNYKDNIATSGDGEKIHQKNMAILYAFKKSEIGCLAKILYYIQLATNNNLRLNFHKYQFLIKWSHILSAWKGNPDCVIELLKCGVDTSRNDDRKNNLMHLAVINNNIEMLAFLHENFPDIIKEPNTRDYTPLQLAVNLGKQTCVQKLIELGADVNIKNFLGYNLMHLAVINNDIEMLAFLHPKSPTMINEKDTNEKTPLDLAKQLGSSYVPKLQELLDSSETIASAPAAGGGGGASGAAGTDA